MSVFSFSTCIPQFKDNCFTTYVTQGAGDIFSFLQNQKYVTNKHSNGINYLKKIIVVNQDTMYFFKKFNSLKKVNEFEKFVFTTSYKEKNNFISISQREINCVVLIDYYDHQSFSHSDTFYFNDKNELFHQSKIYEFNNDEFIRFFDFLPASFFKIH
jgi:phenylalanyl-tRNA synthetase alpha subunit